MMVVWPARYVLGTAIMFMALQLAQNLIFFISKIQFFAHLAKDRLSGQLIRFTASAATLITFLKLQLLPNWEASQAFLLIRNLYRIFFHSLSNTWFEEQTSSLQFYSDFPTAI